MEIDEDEYALCDCCGSFATETSSDDGDGNPLGHVQCAQCSEIARLQSKLDGCLKEIAEFKPRHGEESLAHAFRLERNAARAERDEALSRLDEALERDRKGDEIIHELTLERDRLAGRLGRIQELCEQAGDTNELFWKIRAVFQVESVVERQEPKGEFFAVSIYTDPDGPGEPPTGFSCHKEPGVDCQAHPMTAENQKPVCE